MKAYSIETQRRLAPMSFSPDDRLRIGITKDGSKFVVTPYAVREQTCVIAGEEERVVHHLGELQNIIEEMGGSASVRIEKREVRVHASYKANRDWLKRVPERKEVFLGGSFASWELAVTDLTVAVIDALWKPNQIVFEDDEARIAYEYIRLLIEQLDRNAEITARFKENKEVPRDRKLILHPDKPLADYQQVALYNSLHSEGYGLFMEQGTGKTPIVIARVCNECGDVYETERRAYRVLIVCPKNVRLNWFNEFEAFKTCAGTTTVVRGGPVRRFKSLINAIANPGENDQFTAIVVSYETMARMKELLSISWDLVVGDESHFFKSWNADRTQAMIKLRDCARARMPLSGTPLANTVMDLSAQFEFMFKGGSGFRSFHNFKEFHGRYRPTEAGFEKMIGVQNLPFMKERLARQSFIITKKEALPNLPEKLYDVYESEMTEQQQELYDQLRKHLAIEIENEIDRAQNKALVVNNILTKLLRLAQITSGFVVWSGNHDDLESAPKREVERLHPSPKLDAAVEILREKDPLEKTITWCCWVPDIVDLKARLDVEGIDAVTYYGNTSDDERAEAEYRFNCDPKCRVLIGNPAAGGTGVNLRGYDLENESTSLTNVTQVLYLSQNWSRVARSQSEDRCHGKNRCRVPIRYTDIVVPGTIDEEIRVRVLDKTRTAMEVSDLQSILHNVLHGVIGDE